MSSQTSPPIEVRGLTKRYRDKTAVDGIDFAIEPGTIFAYLGPNGAGKTTTIQCLTDIQRPTSGEARLFGVDSRKLGSEEFQRIGYVSENQKLHEWMTVQQLLDYCRPLYPNWDEPFCQQLLAQFELPRDQKIKSLSRGMKMKAALVSSLAYRPEILILDEPFSGLDPVVREDFIEGVLELTAGGDWTIFVSSHDIDDVERLADRVAILDEGKIILDESADSLRDRFRKLSFGLADADAQIPDALPAAWLRPRAASRRVELVESSFEPNGLEERIREFWPEATGVEAERMTLKEIYLAIIRSAKSTAESS